MYKNKLKKRLLILFLISVELCILTFTSAFYINRTMIYKNKTIEMQQLKIAEYNNIIGWGGTTQYRDSEIGEYLDYLIENFNIKKYAKRFEQFDYPIVNPELSYIWRGDCEFTIRTNYFHDGIDIVSPYDYRVLSTASGTVYQIKHNDLFYDNYIIIKHSDNWYSFYGHLAEIFVNENDVISQKQEIGMIGGGGLNLKGLHLHFSIYKIENNKKTYYNFFKNSLHKARYFLKYEVK